MIKHYLQCDTCCCQWHNENDPSIFGLIHGAQAWGWVHEGMVDYCPACRVESAQHTTAASGTQAPCGGLSFDERETARRVQQIAELGDRVEAELRRGGFTPKKANTAACHLAVGLSDLKGEFTTESGVTFKTKEN